MVDVDATKWISDIRLNGLGLGNRRTPRLVPIVPCCASLGRYLRRLDIFPQLRTLKFTSSIYNPQFGFASKKNKWLEVKTTSYMYLYVKPPATYCSVVLPKVNDSGIYLITSNRLNIAPPQRRFQIPAVAGWMMVPCPCMKPMSNPTIWCFTHTWFEPLWFLRSTFVGSIPMHLCPTRTPHLWPLVTFGGRVLQAAGRHHSDHYSVGWTDAMRWTLQGVSSGLFGWS